MNRILLTIGILSLSVILPAKADWAAFDRPPLTILSPESTALSNPPFLHWQAVPGARLYTVRLSGPGGELSWRTERNFFTPASPLPAGSYALQVEASTGSGLQKPSVSTESTRHGFSIPESAPGIVADWNTLTSVSAIRLALPVTELESLRSATGERAEFRDRLLAQARRPRPEILSTFSEPLRYTDGKWNYSDWSQNNRICEVAHDHLLRQIAACLITGENRFLEESRAIMAALAAWDPKGATGVWENDHSAWHLLHGLAIGYNLLGERLPIHEKQVIFRALKLRCEDMYRFLNPFVGKDTSAGRMNDPDNNHPWFCAAALGFGGLALQGELPEARDWSSFSAQLFHGMFLPRGGWSGAWHEGIDYWSYTLYFVLQIADALKEAGGPDLYRHPWLANTAAFKIYTHPPTGGYVPFGDCKHNPPNAFDKLVMMRFASAYNDPLAWKYVDSIPDRIDDPRLYLALQWSGNRTGSVNPATELPFAKLYDDVGWMVSNSAPFERSDQVIVAFRSGPFFGRKFGHSHGDQNSFIVTAGGDKLLWDAGYYDSYLSPHNRDYSRHSTAHNTLLVDGNGQVVHTAGLDGRITRFEVEGTSVTVQGDASEPLIYGGRIDKFLRTLSYNDKNRIEVQDEIILREPGQVSWLLHSTFPFEYDSAANAFRVVGTSFTLEGSLESSAPVSAILSEGFPVDPASNFRYPATADGKPERQFHLEWKTTEKLQEWYPRVRIRLKPTSTTMSGRTLTQGGPDL